MPDETKASPSPRRKKLPLHDVIIFVSQQLVSSRMALHEQCTALGGKFVWVFDAPFTHYVCQGKLTKRGKEYRKVEEYRAVCVHPAWLKACQKFGHRVTEKLYASTYDPNRSLSFVSAGDDDDEDEENHIPSLRTMLPTPSVKSTQILRPVSLKHKKTNADHVKPAPVLQPSPSSFAPSSSKLSPCQISNEAETMLHDLESSLAQFLNNNTTAVALPSRPSTTDDESNRPSRRLIASMSSMNQTSDQCTTVESSMRVEWLDDAMQAERKKIIDEDESGASSQKQSQCGEAHAGHKRPLVDSNFDSNFNAKKIRIHF